MPKKKTMIYLTERQQWQLKLQAEETGESMSGLIRTAVDEFLARERPQIDYMAIVGMFETEPDNASQRVDEIVGEAVLEDHLRSHASGVKKAVELPGEQQNHRKGPSTKKKSS